MLPPALKKLIHYALYSGSGLVLDTVVFVGLTHAAMPISPFWANMVGGAVASTYVYFGTAKKIFEYRGHFLWPKWLAYVGYILGALLLASAIIGWLATHTPLPALACKLALVPVQFFLNYFALGAILRAFEKR